MAIIQSDNLGIEKHLVELERLIEEGGGGLHSGLVIRSEGGDLSVRTKDPLADGREIIRLSRHVLLADDQYEVCVKDGAFSLSFPNGCLFTDLQKRLAECMIALYNETDKVALHKSGSTLLAIKDYPELVAALKDIRDFPEHMLHWLDVFQDGADDTVLNNFIAETFFKTRFLGYGDPVRVASVSILMPVIDFLNHNWSGGVFNIAHQGARSGDISVGSHVLEEGGECFAFYGSMDAMDSYLRYDFADLLSPVVRSVEMDLEVPGDRRLLIGSPPGGMSRKKLSQKQQALKKYMPTFPEGDEIGDRTVKASHVFIPVGDRAPRSLVRILGIALTHLERKTEPLERAERKDWLREAEYIILKRNKEAYQSLLSLATRLVQENPGAVGPQQVKTLAEHQLSGLEAYEFVDDLNAEIAA